MCQVEGTAHVQAQRQDHNLLKACPWTLDLPSLFSSKLGAKPWETPSLNQRCLGSDMETLTSHCPSPHHALICAIGHGVLRKKMSWEGFVLAGGRPIRTQAASDSLWPCWPPCLSLPAFSQHLCSLVLVHRVLQSVGVTATDGLAICPSS